MVSLNRGACRGVLIYLAGPLFSEAERRFNLELKHRLEVIGFDVLLPQRVERHWPPYDTMTPEERRHAMFRLDKIRILDADVFVFDGRVPDQGACVELGIAYRQKYLQNGKKLLVGVHTDTRVTFIGGRLKPMAYVPLEYVVDDDEEKLLRLVTDLRSGVEAGSELPG
jgi:Nucleoside 2-deoxyribosyltransferase